MSTRARLARLEHIGVGPGAAFSTTRRFDHFIRLQYGEPFTAATEAAMKRLGHIVERLAKRGLAASDARASDEPRLIDA